MIFINFLLTFFVIFFVNLFIRYLINNFYKKFKNSFIVIDSLIVAFIFVMIDFILFIKKQYNVFDWYDYSIEILVILFFTIFIPLIYFFLKKKYLKLKQIEVSIYYPIIEIAIILISLLILVLVSNIISLN